MDNHKFNLFADFLDDFRQGYNNTKVVFVVTGGGVGICDLLKIPGSSNIVESVFIPYGTNSGNMLLSKEYIEKYSSVSQEITEAMVASLNLGLHDNMLSYDNNIIMACSAALTTSRWRRGENHAWISWLYPGSGTIKSRHVKLNKPTKHEYEKMTFQEIVEQRDSEDNILVQTMLQILRDYKNA